MTEADPEPVPDLAGHDRPARRRSPTRPRPSAGSPGCAATSTPRTPRSTPRVAMLNRALHAHRAARADPHARDVSAEAALVVRIGYGPGDAVADGRFARGLGAAAGAAAHAALDGGARGALRRAARRPRAGAGLRGAGAARARRPRRRAARARPRCRRAWRSRACWPRCRRSRASAGRRSRPTARSVGRAANAALTGELGRRPRTGSRRGGRADGVRPARPPPRQGLKRHAIFTVAVEPGAVACAFDSRSSRRPASLANWR